MDAKDLLKKVRKIEIKTRGLSQNIFAGEYHSAFKGRGMMFSEVREYQFGDDIRRVVGEVLSEQGVEQAKVHLVDRGALDCVIRARVETAILRAKGE